MALDANDPQIQAAATGVLAAANQQAMDTFMTQALSVNLDEVDISTFPVAFVEWDATKVTGADGVERQTFKPRVRHVELSNYVPMSAFNHMMSLREDVMRAARANGGQPNTQAMLEMMGQAVLPVWQLSEPEMTLARLVKGLDLPRMQGVYGRFINAALQQQKSNQENDSTGRGA